MKFCGFRHSYLIPSNALTVPLWRLLFLGLRCAANPDQRQALDIDGEFGAAGVVCMAPRTACIASPSDNQEYTRNDAAKSNRDLA